MTTPTILGKTETKYYSMNTPPLSSNISDLSTTPKSDTSMQIQTSYHPKTATTARAPSKTY
jgi:hypothetical protein